METVRTTRYSTLESLTARLVAGDKRLAPAVAHALAPVRLLQALGELAEGTLTDAPWEAERFRALLLTALDGPLIPLDFDDNLPDSGTGLWFPEDSLLVLPSLGLLSLAAARVGFVMGQAPAWRDAVFSLSLAVALAESLLRDDANGATDLELGLLLDAAVDGTRLLPARVAALGSGDPVERARFQAIGALWQTLQSVELSVQTSLTVTALSPTVPPPWMCLPERRIVVLPDALGIDKPGDKSDAILIAAVEGGLLEPLGRLPGSPPRHPIPPNGGWVGVFDRKLAVRANKARDAINKRLAVGRTDVGLQIPMVGTEVGLAPSPCSIRLPGAQAPTASAPATGSPYTRLLFTPVGLDLLSQTVVVAGPRLAQEDGDRSFPWGPDLLSVLPYTPVEDDDPLLDEIMDELARVAMDGSGLGECVLQVQLPLGTVLRVGRAEGALARVIASEGVDPARVIEAVQALGPASPATRHYGVRVRRFRGGQLGLLPGRMGMRSRGSGGACDTDIDAVALDGMGRVLGRRRLSVLTHGDEALLGALVTAPEATVQIALRRGEETLLVIDRPLVGARLRVEGTASDGTVTSVRGEGDPGLGAAACVTVEVALDGNTPREDQRVWLPWRCLGAPPLHLTLPTSELNVACLIRLVPEDGWFARPVEVPHPHEEVASFAEQARRSASVRIVWHDRAVLLQLLQSAEGGAFTLDARAREARWALDGVPRQPEDSGVLRLEGTEKGRLSASLRFDDAGPPVVVAERALGMICCANPRPRREVLLCRPQAEGAEDVGAPLLAALGAQAGLDLQVRTHPLLTEDRLAVLPRWPISEEDPLTIELLCALSSEALRTVGAERWLWLALVDAPGDWFCRAEAAGAWQIVVATRGALPALLKLVASLPESGSPPAGRSLRLSGLVHGGARLSLCDHRVEERVPGGAEPYATGLVARLKDAAGRTLREVDLRGPQEASPAPLRALVPLDPAARTVEVWTKTKCIRTLPLDSRLPAIQRLQLEGETLSWTLFPPREGEIAAEHVVVDLHVSAEEGGLCVPLAVGDAVTGSLDLPLHHASTLTPPRIVARTRTGACLGAVDGHDLLARLSDPAVIRRLDPGSYRFVDGGESAVTWRRLGVAEGPALPDGDVVRVEEGQGSLEGERDERVDRRSLVAGCPCGDPPPSLPLVLLTPWVDDGADGLRASTSAIERALRVLERDLGVGLLPVWELAWVEDGLAVVPDLPAGPDDPLVADLLDHLWLRSLRSVGGEGALWMVALPGGGEWVREGESPSARRLLVGPTAGLVAFLRREMEPQLAAGPPIASGQLGVILQATEGGPVRVIEVEQSTRPRHSGAVLAPTGPFEIRVVTRGRARDRVHLEPRLSGSAPFYAAMVPASGASDGADILTPRDTLRVSRPSRGPGEVARLSLRDETLSWTYDAPLGVPAVVRGEAALGPLWTPFRARPVGQALRIPPGRLPGGATLRIAANDGWQSARPAAVNLPILPAGRGPLRAILRPLGGGRTLVDTGREAPEGTTYRVETSPPTPEQGGPVFGDHGPIQAASVLCPGDRPLVWSGPASSSAPSTAALSTTALSNASSSTPPLPSLTGWPLQVAHGLGSVVSLLHDGTLLGPDYLPSGRFLDIAPFVGGFALLREDGAIRAIHRRTTELGRDALALTLRGRPGEDRLLILRRDGAVRVAGPKPLSEPLFCCCKPLRDAALWGDTVLVVTHDGRIRLHTLEGGQPLPLPGDGGVVARRVWAQRSAGAWVWTEDDHLVRLSRDETTPPVTRTLPGATAVEVQPETGRVAWVDAENRLHVDGPDPASPPFVWPVLQLHWVGERVLALSGARRDLPDPPEVATHALD